MEVQSNGFAKSPPTHATDPRGGDLNTGLGIDANFEPTNSCFPGRHVPTGQYSMPLGSRRSFHIHCPPYDVPT